MVDLCYAVINEQWAAAIWYHYDCVGIPLSESLRLGASKNGFVCPHCSMVASDVSDVHADYSTNGGQDLLYQQHLRNPQSRKSGSHSIFRLFDHLTSEGRVNNYGSLPSC